MTESTDILLAEASESELMEMEEIMRYLQILNSVNPQTGRTYTQIEALNKLGYSSYATVQRWRSNGMIAKTLRVMLQGLSSRFNAAAAMAWDAWGAIVERQITVATDPGTKHSDALAAARWIYEIFIGPGLALSEDPGAEELDYLRHQRSLDPMAPLGGNLTINVSVGGEDQKVVPGRFTFDDD